ncbi:major facilitator superfamily domain-containing protein [Coniella lustricola]|uniref:Major facilitator superfamily domain-containing protein n=1 Tax=Coniella lustricola TaxID=2025994 RepID=A0A2T2ZTV8_9PEZI|nr:major facilitator superfamily domain-containing protein [Coniella lustricola]
MDTARDFTMPPGTIRLEKASSANSTTIILSPPPTSDPHDPLNWTSTRKTVNFTLTLFYVLFTFVLNDIFYVAYTPLVEEIGMTYEVYNIATALGFAGLAIGCIVFMPFSYRYGRRPLYILSVTIQLVAAIWSGKVKTNGELIAANMLMGLGGAISETIVQVTIADLFFVHQYATVNALFLFAQATGASLGPVAAGYVIDGQGWRWMWWWCAIFLGITLIVVFFCFEETIYTAVYEGVPAYTSPDEVEAPKQDPDDTKMTQTTSDQLAAVGSLKKKPLRRRLQLVTNTNTAIKHHFYQPFLMLIKFPAIAYAAITYGSLLALFSILGTVLAAYLTYSPWDFSPANVGLFNVASFVGSLAGTIMVSIASDRLVIVMAKRNSGVYEAEMRLYPAIPGSFITAAGVLMVGLGLEKGMSWVFLAFGSAIFSAGFVLCADTALCYLTDTYGNIIGDALVAVIFVRNGLSVVIMFALTPWIEGMGVQNAFILMAIIAFVILSIPLPLLKWGKQARIKSAATYAHYSMRQPNCRGGI